jgi:hypothetical protein
MRASKSTRAAPPDADSAPQKIELLAGQLDFKNLLAEALRQAENLAALVGTIDPALVAGL